VLAAVTAPLVGAGLPLAALPLGLMALGVVGVLVPPALFGPALAATTKVARGAGAGGLALAYQSGRHLSALGAQALETARQARSEWAAGQMASMVPVRVRSNRRRG
jgi:hypothetical protein